MKNLPPITPKQKEILMYLYSFRFLNTHQFQKLFNHRDPHRVKEWLKDLRDKQYIGRYYDPKSFIQNTQPAIYYLRAKSRHILKNEKVCNLAELERVYKEHTVSEKFVNHWLTIGDIYLFLLSQKELDEELEFFTKSELRSYTYFPKELPDAFISIKGEENIRRYFLVLIDPNTPPGVARAKFRAYMDYYQNSEWAENTDNADFPSILFVYPNESLKSHIFHYGKSVLEKTFDDISFFLTTVDTIKFSKGDVWQKVE